MQCASVRLQERSRPRLGAPKHNAAARNRRYCQKRLVDPDHEEDPRWTGELVERFRCEPVEPHDTSAVVDQVQENNEDLYLTVQTLKFQGDVKERNKHRSCFKYKSANNGNTHRMFVKEIVEDNQQLADDCVSQDNYDYFDNYIKYILNSDRSWLSTGRSSVSAEKENKSVQVDCRQANQRRHDVKAKGQNKKIAKTDTNVENNMDTAKESPMNDTKISYHKNGKRKSITISRAQSPETVQVIRVDVVCNYSNSTSALSNYNEINKQDKNREPNTSQKLESQNCIDLRSTRFANKYLLTKTIKSLDQNVSGGAKVTLLCKTFRLSDRNKFVAKNSVARVLNPLQ